MIDPRGLAWLIADAIVLIVIVLKPFLRNYDDDSDLGSGSRVIMQPPLKPSYLRCGTFLLVSFAVSIFLVGFRSPSLDGLYHRLVGQLLLAAVRDPAAVSHISYTTLPVFRVSILAFGVAFAVAFRATLARRVMILLNCALFLLISAVADAFFGLFVIETGLPLGPTPVFYMLVQYLIAGIAVFRVAFTSFRLPNKTAVPLRRHGDLRHDVVLVGCVFAAVVAVGAGATALSSAFGNDPFVVALIAFACPPYLIVLISLFLGFARLVGPRRVDPVGAYAATPPVEVIIPAFNEELNIARLLRSLDVAAGRYRGPVRVILCDDGSTDGTRALAAEAMAAFEHATGEIVPGAHGGKSAALNTALAQCRAEYVYRVDADCLVHPDCIVYSIPHFLADPTVGLVGAFTLPKEPFTTWIDRMRLFEMIVGFGFGRPCSDVVDGIACVPGTFTAFRRAAALEIGGFVDKMYGEDVDFTCSIARLGYRAVIDTRVRSYEDVPNTVGQLRVQRTRWSRGGSMAFARHVPVVTGLAGPRSWFFTVRASAKRWLVPINLTTLTYLLSLAIFRPSVHVDLIKVVFIMLFKAVPGLLQVIICATYYRKARYLGWLPLRYPFVLLKHYFGLEALLSFNARPVVTPSITAALRPQWRRSRLTPVEVQRS